MILLMPVQKPKILIVVGPTASGKSGLGVHLAKIFDGEVISADSRQVYKGMDIGTGKITKKEMRGIPHHLLDILDPKKTFSADDFRKYGTIALENILQTRKLPIIVGGTGFYVDSLLGNTSLPQVAPNPKLRKALEKESTEALFKKLQKLDSARSKIIDSKNKVRLIRALEIIESLGKVPKLTNNKQSKTENLYIGLLPKDDVLKKLIHTRLLARIKKGMILEVQKLHSGGVSWKRMNELGLEYRFIAQHLQNMISKEKLIEDLERAIWQYVKRQKTWFKANKEIHWFDPSLTTSNKKIETLVKKFLKKQLSRNQKIC